MCKYYKKKKVKFTVEKYKYDLRFYFCEMKNGQLLRK